MSRLVYLREQVARAERMLAYVGDALTIERLRLYADDCRREIEQLAGQQQLAA